MSLTLKSSSIPRHSTSRWNVRRISSRSGVSQIQTAVIVVGVIVIVFGTIVAAVWILPSSSTWPFGSIIGTGKLVTEEKPFSDFTIVDVEDGFEVKITQSSSFSVSITADDNVIDDIQVSKRGETLNIGLAPDLYGSLTLRAEITMPDLYELQFSGGTHGTARGFSSSHSLVLDLSGGSRIELEGAANDLFIDASGGSHLALSDFSVNDANVELSGGSDATINLDGRLDYDLSGGSRLYYIGEPTLGDIETSGGSTVRKR